jgi:hypothetical protein
MNFQGYIRVLCSEGHLHESDVYLAGNLGDPEWRCHCGAAEAWQEIVDTTNGEVTETHLVERQEIVEVCPTCSGGGLVRKRLFKVPQKGGQS